MLPIFSPYLFYRLAGQLLALFVLYFALTWLLPIAGALFFNGMLLWSNAGIFYCWLLQFACMAVTVELRDTLAQKAKHWFTQVPRHRLRLVLGLANVLVVLVLLCMLSLLIQSIPAFSVATAIEFLLLLVQVWCLCGVAVPMSAKRFYVFFFHTPKPSHENTEWQFTNHYQ